MLKIVESAVIGMPELLSTSSVVSSRVQLLLHFEGDLFENSQLQLEINWANYTWHSERTKSLLMWIFCTELLIFRAQQLKVLFVERSSIVSSWI